MSVEWYPAGTTPASRVVACELRFLLARAMYLVPGSAHAHRGSSSSSSTSYRRSQRDRGRVLVVPARVDSRHIRGSAYASRRRAVWRADGACTDGLILSDGRDWGESGVRAGCTAAWNTAGSGMHYPGVRVYVLVAYDGTRFQECRRFRSHPRVHGSQRLNCCGHRGALSTHRQNDSEFSEMWLRAKSEDSALAMDSSRGALEARETAIQLPGDADDEIPEDNAWSWEPAAAQNDSEFSGMWLRAKSTQSSRIARRQVRDFALAVDSGRFEVRGTAMQLPGNADDEIPETIRGLGSQPPLDDDSNHFGIPPALFRIEFMYPRYPP
ncbi:hypothetical protein DFH09DRAFT_1090394 [Mycena vulgaris]|nr:hypothetical protein DFH09DRAFT_1090394 [Mycena vulgaris]